MHQIASEIHEDSRGFHIPYSMSQEDAAPLPVTQPFCQARISPQTSVATLQAQSEAQDTYAVRGCGVANSWWSPRKRQTCGIIASCRTWSVPLIFCQLHSFRGLDCQMMAL